MDEILKSDHSNERHWTVLSWGVVSYAIQSGSIFGGYEQDPKCERSSKSYWAVLPFGAVYYAAHDGSNFRNKILNPTIQIKPIELYFPVDLLIMLYKVILTF